MVGTLLTWSVLTAGGAWFDGCEANNPYLYFPFKQHGDEGIVDREEVTVVPRPVFGLGTNWDKRAINADFVAGIDFQVLPCQVHPVRHFAAHLFARVRHESGWTFEPGIGFSWFPEVLKYPQNPSWLTSELTLEVGPTFGLQRSLSGVHARVTYWLPAHFVGVEAGVRYDAGRWVPAITVQVDAMLLAVLVSFGVRAGAGSRGSNADSNRW